MCQIIEEKELFNSKTQIKTIKTIVTAKTIETIQYNRMIS